MKDIGGVVLQSPYFQKTSARSRSNKFNVFARFVFWGWIGFAGAAQSAEAPIDISKFDCSHCMPDMAACSSALAKSNVTVGLATGPQFKEVLNSACMEGGGDEPCTVFSNFVVYSFSGISFLKNERNLRADSEFQFLQEAGRPKPGSTSTRRSGIFLDEGRRYLIISASPGLLGLGQFLLDAACELP
jgi:hypothetical protein